MIKPGFGPESSHVLYQAFLLCGTGWDPEGQHGLQTLKYIYGGAPVSLPGVLPCLTGPGRVSSPNWKGEQVSVCAAGRLRHMVTWSELVLQERADLKPQLRLDQA